MKPINNRLNVELFNGVFGGGITLGSINLIAGPPGAGKTTLSLMLAGLILSKIPHSKALVIVNEQTPTELDIVRVRLGIKYKNRFVVTANIDNLLALLEYHKPKIIIIDSFTMLTFSDVKRELELVTRFKQLATKLQSTVLLISHTNKNGDIAGSGKLLSLVDGVFYLDKDDHDGRREFYSTKNRFGIAPKSQFLKMANKNGILVSSK